MKITTPILGLLVSGALIAGCSHDTTHETAKAPRLVESVTTLPASLEQVTPSPIIPVPPVAPEPVPAPVDPATAKAAWHDGVMLFDRKDYSGAVDKLKVAAAGEPQQAYRLYLLGLAQWKSGDPTTAEGSLSESTKLDSGQPKTWINLARVRHELNDRNGALEAAEQALQLDSTSADALHQKGRALMELGRGAEALETLKAAHDADPGNGYIANTFGLALVRLGRPTEAIEPLEAARTALPGVAYVRNNLGLAYLRTGRVDEARAEYAAARQLGTQDTAVAVASTDAN
jgi:Flp pilus assembly protein TadD